MRLYSDCDFFGDAQDDYPVPILGGCESCYRYEICKSAKHMEEILDKEDSRCELIPIKDFIDFNYCNIAFDITGVDRDLLMEKLKHDYVNHLYELEDSKYIAIWNCDLQGFIDVKDIYFDTTADSYKMAKLVYKDDGWYYHITSVRKIPEE